MIRFLILFFIAFSVSGARGLPLQARPGSSSSSRRARLTDIIGRLIGAKITESWGQPVVVDNTARRRRGHRHETAAKAPADGYTLVMAVSSAFGINPGLVAEPALRRECANFALINNIVFTPQTLIVPASSPAKSMKELVALAKEKPGALNYARWGRARPAPHHGTLPQHDRRPAHPRAPTRAARPPTPIFSPATSS